MSEAQAVAAQEFPVTEQEDDGAALTETVQLSHNKKKKQKTTHKGASIVPCAWRYL